MTDELKKFPVAELFLRDQGPVLASEMEMCIEISRRVMKESEEMFIALGYAGRPDLANKVYRAWKRAQVMLWRYLN